MSFSFEAKIYKVGINLCVKVPREITDKMRPRKGYIPVKGNIVNYPFVQTLCPVKNEEYRLYVNGLMLKGSGTVQGDTVSFKIEQDFETVEKPFPMPGTFKKALDDHDLTEEFEKLIPSRKKEILSYLNYLKTDEALFRNIEKVIVDLKKRKSTD